MLPNRLDSSEQWPITHGRQVYWLIGCLFLICLLLRLSMAWQINVNCSDSYFYVSIARHIEDGEISTAFRWWPFNLYPFLLAGVHQLGFDWESGGQLWSVLAASLVALPMFGLMRRQFNDTIAVVACLLYAFHAHLIEYSPEPIRDPTFWLLAQLTLYLAWRGSAERNSRLYALACCCWGLGVFVRVEGWLLLVPILGWPLVKWWSTRHQSAARSALLAKACGIVVAVALVVGSIVWINSRVGGYLAGQVELVATVVNDASTQLIPSASTAEESQQLRSKLWYFAHRLERGVKPDFLILLGIGIFGNLWLFFRRDQLPLMLAGLMLLAAIWIKLSPAGNNLNSRYFFPVVLWGVGFAALGLGTLVQVLLRGFYKARSWLQPAGRASAHVGSRRLYVLATIQLLLCLLGTIDALTMNNKNRQAWADFGQTLGAYMTPGDAIAIGKVPQQTGYRTNHRYTGFTRFNVLQEIVDEQPPRLIVISRGLLKGTEFANFSTWAATHGYSELPETAPQNAALVLIRQAGTAQPPLAQQPVAEQRQTQQR